MAPQNAPAIPSCPKCGSDFIDRRRRQGIVDYFHYLFGRFPFSCRRCGSEFYLWRRNLTEQNL